MAEVHLCSVCKRTLEQKDRWIMLDGKQIWCAECWSQRFAGSTVAPDATPSRAEPLPPKEPPPPAPDFGLTFDPVPPQASTPIMLERPVTAAHAVPAAPAPAAAASGVLTARPGILIPPRQPTTSAAATASLVCSLVGIFGVFLGPILGVVGVIFGAIALNTTSKNPAIRGQEMAMAGLLTGIVDIIGWLVVIAIWLLWPGGS